MSSPCPAKACKPETHSTKCFPERDYKFKVRVELNEVNILLKLIKKSNLVTILSEATIHDESGVKAIPLDVNEYEMEGCIHTLKHAYRKHSALKFIHTAQRIERHPRKDAHLVRIAGRNGVSTYCRSRARDDAKPTNRTRHSLSRYWTY